MTLETPFPYQEQGAKWLASMEHALLGDEMGLGKSAQVVIACDHVGAFNILVVCPAAVRVNWDREFSRFSPMDRPSQVLMTGQDRPKPGVNVVSYDLLTNEKLKAACKAQRWDVLVLDEAHYLKERSSKRTKAIYGHAKYPGVMHSAKRCWRLSGTPAPNNASELYTHLKSAGLETRPYWDFVYDFCAGFDSDFGYKITGHKNTAKLKALLAQFMLRRKKDDVLKDLPEITFQNITVERSKVPLDPYFFENWFPIGITKWLHSLEHMDKSLKIGLAAQRESSHFKDKDAIALLSSMATTTATLRRYIGMAKAPAVLDIIAEELEGNAYDKIVIFAVHKDVIEMARERLKKFKPVQIYGGTPGHRRQQMVDKFQNESYCRVFIGQIVAAGTGITLTAAKEVAFLESSWVPADNAQAAMRCHRVGQTRNVRVRFFTCAGSVDEDVMRVVSHKTREIAKIID